MKTVVISGDAAMPEELRDMIVRGSTSVEERRARDVGEHAPPPDADRIVFWTSGRDGAMTALAGQYARAERAQRKEKLVFVSAGETAGLEGLSPNEIYVWPKDEDRLRMAFMTGA